MAGLTSLTGGGGLSAGGGGPSTATSTAKSGIDSTFNVTFGGGKAAQLAPYMLVAVVVVAWLLLRKKR